MSSGRKPKIDKQKGRGSIKVPNVKSGAPQGSGRGRGSIDIGAYGDIEWTPKKAIIVGILLVVPYIGVIITLYLVGLKMLAVILTGITVLCGLLVMLARWIENAEL